MYVNFPNGIWHKASWRSDPRAIQLLLDAVVDTSIRNDAEQDALEFRMARW
jgi:hypothetical protein